MILQEKKIDGELFEKILTFGALNLQANIKEINDLNVFPVPDGDTGSNMYATLIGGIDTLQKEYKTDIEQKAGALAKGMLLNARGNSGVILSQLFYGIAQGLLGLKVATIPQFAGALNKGVEFAYKAVVKPVEGTILTVAREAAERVYNQIDDTTTVERFFKDYASQLKLSLSKTPELLQVLKESGVVDSGGAGLVCIAEGFYRAIIGDENISEVAFTVAENNDNQQINFDKNSKMDYGYCTEALVQLLESKDGLNKFNLQEFTEFLSSIGDSVVAVRTDDKVKVHVHTLTPAKVIEKCQIYGEFVSVKIENMTIQHSNITANQTSAKNKKTCAIVAVASGEGFKEIYKEYGADYVIFGGQTDNPSTEEFIKAFDAVNAKTIFVLPNNKNIVLAAKQAGDLYENAEVVVIPTKTPQQVYSALMVSTERENLEILQSDMQDAIDGTESYAITYAVRDALINGIDIKKDDYMAFYEGDLMLEEKSLEQCFKQMLENIDDLKDKEIITVFYGKNFSDSQKDAFSQMVNLLCPDAELIEYDGGQDVYPLLIAME